jgi:hypothetical protein
MHARSSFLRRSRAVSVAFTAARRHRLTGLIAVLCRSVLAGLVLVAGMPQARAATLLTWDITGSTGTSSGSAPSSLAVGVSGSAMTAGAGTTTGNSTSPGHPSSNSSSPPSGNSSSPGHPATNSSSPSTVVARRPGQHVQPARGGGDEGHRGDGLQFHHP